MSEANDQNTPPAVRWTAELAQTISQPPLLMGDVLLLAVQPSGPIVQDSGLRALDLATGDLRWQHAFTYALVAGMQAYELVGEDETSRPIAVVATSSSDILQGEGALLAFDAAGEIMWQWQGKEQIYHAPLVQDRQVYVVAGSKTLIIVRPEDEGDDQTLIPLPVTAAQAAVTVAEGVAYVPCRGPELLAIALDGSERWRFQFQGSKREWLDKTPLVTPEFVFTVSSQGAVFALERVSGHLVWQATLGEKMPLSQPLLHEDRLYVGLHTGLAALDVRNGRLLWQHTTSRPVSAVPLLAGDCLYCTCEDHFLYALDRESGALRWQVEMSRRIEQPPLLAPTALLAADRGGQVLALEAPSLPDGEPVASVSDPTFITKQMERTAVAYETAAKPLLAAALWLELGELERAAQQYEAGLAWNEAARVWQQLDRYSKRAYAVEQLAQQQLSDEQLGDEEKALAWEQAAHAYAETGQKEERQRCERKVAELRQEPILALAIEPEGPMEINAWTKVSFTVRNEGFGVARSLAVKIKDDRFEGQTASTQTIVTLAPGRDYNHWLDVSPKAHGASVPMQLVIEYLDKANRAHKLERTFYLEVFEDDEVVQNRLLPGQTGALLEGWESVVLPVPATDLRELYNKLLEHFSAEELRMLILGLGLNADALGDEHVIRVRRLIEYMVRSKRLSELLDACREERPNIEW